jgi:hypothetical protein
MATPFIRSIRILHTSLPLISSTWVWYPVRNEHQSKPPTKDYTYFTMYKDKSVSPDRSTLRDFLGSVATVQGDLSNITAPPSILSKRSTVELPQYLVDHPHLFVAPTKASSPEERALAVLKRFLSSLKSQQYAGQKPEDGIKKPLNAFLGELFLASWSDDDVGETKLVSEQVSHHPPVTACYIWNEKHGVSAEGFTCQEITFSGNVNIKQKGYAIMHLDQHDEDYLLPFPSVKIKNILSGSPYPELQGKYSIVGSNGYVSEIKFEGKGLLYGGTRNGVEARIYHIDEPSKDIFTVEGSWNDQLIFKDVRSGKTIEKYHIDAEKAAKPTIADISKQDPWETGVAWKDVRQALKRGDIKGVTDAKSTVEEGQRHLRREEQKRGAEWAPVFFKRQTRDSVFQKLSPLSNHGYNVDEAGGIWKVNKDAILNARRPYHGEILPTGECSSPHSSNNPNREANDVAAWANQNREPSKQRTDPCQKSGYGFSLIPRTFVLRLLT